MVAQWVGPTWAKNAISKYMYNLVVGKPKYTLYVGVIGRRWPLR